MGKDGGVVGAGEERLHARQTADIGVLFPADPGAVDGCERANHDPGPRDGHDGVAAAKDGDELDFVGRGVAVEVGQEEAARAVKGGPCVDVKHERVGGAGVAVFLRDLCQGFAVAG